MNCESCSTEINDDSKCASCPADATHCKNCHVDGAPAGEDAGHGEDGHKHDEDAGEDAGGSEDAK